MANCYANESPQFQPVMRLIASITNAKNAEVTTTFDHDFVDGTIVRFTIPSYYGMRQLNKKQGVITVTGSDTFTVDINTKRYEAFSVPVSQWYHNSCALVIPIGEISSQFTAAVRDVT